MKKKFIKITEFLSVSEDYKFAHVKLHATIPNTTPDEVSLKGFQTASLAWWEGKHGKAQDNVAVPEGTPNLSEDRYVYKTFRALSQIFLQNRGLDFSRPGVLQKAVDLIKDKTIYANHDFRDIDNWRGVIADAYWDSVGADSNNVPGINVKTKVDAFLNYRTACGLMMNPPAINACSTSVVTEVEFSHPELVKNGTFWSKFLEEVDGEIVRLIATRIIEFWELSFVFLGEDRLAKNLPDVAEEAVEETETRQNLNASEEKKGEKVKVMELTKEQKLALGITTEGNDVSEQAILDAALEIAKNSKLTATDIADLSAKAKAGESLLAEKRKEVNRLATLAENGAEEGTLNSVLAKTINNASDTELVELETYYRSKVADKLSTNQSSLENSEEITKASGLQTEAKQVVKPTKLL